MVDRRADKRATGVDPDQRAAAWLLAVDTSTEQAGVALSDGERVAELSWPAGRTQTVTVLPAVERLLKLCEVDRGGLGAVAVATGPGTFTGLRVGLSIAKGLALARDLPVLGVPTLDVAAEPYAAAGTPVVVVLAAGRGRIVWAAYGLDTAFGASYGPVNTRLDGLVLWLRERRTVLVAGELTSPQREALVEAGHSRIEDAALARRRPAALAALGWRRWRGGAVDDAATLEPVYLHAARQPAAGEGA